MNEENNEIENMGDDPQQDPIVEWPDYSPSLQNNFFVADWDIVEIEEAHMKTATFFGW